MSDTELVALVCCDLGAIVRGRAVPADALEPRLSAGVGWVPANLALTPLGPVAEPNPFGSIGDLRLLPDIGTRAVVPANEPHGTLDVLLCDIVELDGAPWACCPRAFLRDALVELDSVLGARAWASFEHELQIARPPDPGGGSREDRSSLPFSLTAQRALEPFPRRVMDDLRSAGCEPELFFAEYAPRQFEIPLAPCEGLASADRAVTMREVVRESARRLGLRASFAPLADPEQAGNGVHIHLSLRDREGAPLLYDAERPGHLSELGGSFAAGILAHARALTALTAPSPVSAARLSPHRWSAGAVCLALQSREALLRIPPLLALAPPEDAAQQMRLEYRAADAAANPHLALGAIVRAGIDGVRRGLAPAQVLEADPAELDGEDAERHGLGALPRTLEQALAALEEDEIARSWMHPLLYEAFVSVKRAELQAASGVELGELCERYAEIY